MIGSFVAHDTSKVSERNIITLSQNHPNLHPMAAPSEHEVLEQLFIGKQG